MANGFGGIQPFWTDLHAVHNAVATEHTEGVIQVSQALFGGRVATIRQKAIGLQQTLLAEREGIDAAAWLDLGDHFLGWRFPCRDFLHRCPH